MTSLSRFYVTVYVPSLGMRLGGYAVVQIAAQAIRGVKSRIRKTLGGIDLTDVRVVNTGFVSAKLEQLDLFPRWRGHAGGRRVP